MSAGSAAGVPDRRIVLATRNEAKLAELRVILADTLADLNLDLVAVSDFPDVRDVVETGVTFEENARLKATTVADATGLPALADDSGLTVDVLGGAPGVFSARWSGRHGDDRANLDLLVSQLADVPEAHRGAAFVCAACLALPGGFAMVRQARLEGKLTHTPRGAGGFGYDPVLQVARDSRTSAELTPAEKNAISHRGKAFRALAVDLRALIAPT